MLNCPCFLCRPDACRSPVTVDTFCHLFTSCLLDCMSPPSRLSFTLSTHSLHPHPHTPHRPGLQSYSVRPGCTRCMSHLLVSLIGHVFPPPCAVPGSKAVPSVQVTRGPHPVSPSCSTGTLFRHPAPSRPRKHFCPSRLHIVPVPSSHHRDDPKPFLPTYRLDLHSHPVRAVQSFRLPSSVYSVQVLGTLNKYVNET